MTLNFSHRIFPVHLPEENMVQGGSQDRDIRELLPADPFGMDISSTVTAITGWLEDLGADYGAYEGAEVDCKGDYPLFAGWNFWWNNTPMEFQKFPENKKYDDRILNDAWDNSYFPSEEFRLPTFGSADNDSIDKIDSHCMITEDDGYLQEVGFGHMVNDGGVCFNGDEFDTGNDIFNRDDDVCGMSIDMAADTEDMSEPPHPALTYALHYLGVRDLLSVERVCKSLCYTVRNDPLYWRSIHIDNPLNTRLTDEVLLRLTERAQGSLQCLSLVDCQRVTDDGLKRVLGSNLRLTRLSVPKCIKLSVDGVVNCLRAFKTVAVNGIKYLRIGGRYDVTQEQFEELVTLLDIRNEVQNNCHKPLFYQIGNIYISIKDDRPIDIEMCPRCQLFRLVYDCPAEGCQGKDHSTELCRACIICIARCVICGKCVNDRVYEESFSLESHCSDCWENDRGHQERQDVGISLLKRDISQNPVISLNG
ncbi:hypothetical protein SOVF_091720 [Spinacia oleracea]|uniref:F-box protein SKIP14 n=1 Tax=Spinacia oleracea TaxID=3562 RepID=A0A9R0IRX9_SPIOL|nr:F-box protein SKIP14 [Spinacia oleracea]KNA16136.1 hypothetical protein SOVF_091720 [Spinacia oleracea]